MKKARPWPYDSTSVIAGDPITIPVDATTVELTPEEVLAALVLYVGNKLGESYKGYGSLNMRFQSGKILAAQLSIWRLN